MNFTALAKHVQQKGSVYASMLSVEIKISPNEKKYH
jgi:hypothetical protein